MKSLFLFPLFSLFVSFSFFPAFPTSLDSSEVLAQDTTKSKIITIKIRPDGGMLYERLCASCHSIDQRSIGPPLRGVRERIPDAEWMYRWVRNSSALIAIGEPYAVKIFEEYGRAMQPTFELTDEQIDAILEYCDDYVLPTEE